MKDQAHTTNEAEPLAVRRAREYGTDVGLIRALLRMTAEERLRTMEEDIRAVHAARPTGRRAC